MTDREMKSPKQLAEEVAGALDDLWNETPSMDRNRPYNGQRHTDSGERGSRMVEGLTMRDIRDCYIRGLILACGPTDEETEANRALYEEALKGEGASLCCADVFRLKGDYDPIAVSQNMLCEVEKMMGIFPNISETSREDTLRELGLK